VRAGEDLAPLLGAIDSTLITCIGRNIEASPDRSRVIAAVSGVVRMVDGTLFVEPAIQIDSHLDLQHGTVAFLDGGIVIRGGVLDRARVEAGGSVWIGGLIDAASVTAGKDVFVCGGIVQRGRGRCASGGSLSAKFLAGANIEARGDVIAQNEVSNSHVTCFGHLLVERGSIVASTVSATSGVRCGSIGCQASTRAIIEVGHDERLQQLARTQVPEIDELRRRANRIRVVVDPLLRHQKHLSPEGKDKATELLFEANELEVQTQAMLGELQVLYEHVRERAYSAQIIVADAVHPGVVIRFPGMECAIESAIHGPAKILVRERRGEREVVVIDAMGRCTRRLEHKPLNDATMMETHRILTTGD
jgi:uncharacterized protein (DUF342 family)